MDKLTDIYNLILHSNTLNFAIFLAIIIFVCKKIDIAALLENTCNKIKQTIETSERTKKEAQTSKSQAIKSVQNTQQEISNINSAAIDKTKILTEEIVSDTLSKINGIKNNAQKIIDSEKRSIKSNIISNIGQKSVETAKSNILKEIENNIELHSKFIEDSIKEIDKAVLDDIH